MSSQELVAGGEHEVVLPDLPADPREARAYLEEIAASRGNLRIRLRSGGRDMTLRVMRTEPTKEGLELIGIIDGYQNFVCTVTVPSAGDSALALKK